MQGTQTHHRGNQILSIYLSAKPFLGPNVSFQPSSLKGLAADSARGGSCQAGRGNYTTELHKGQAFLPCALLIQASLQIAKHVSLLSALTLRNNSQGMVMHTLNLALGRPSLQASPRTDKATQTDTISKN